MAFNIKDFGGLLDGEMGDISVSDGAAQDINSYVKVTKFTGDVIEIAPDTMIEGKYVTFRAGTQIMLHVSSTNRTTADYLGLYTFANITLVNNETLTLDKNVEEIFAGVNLDYESLQAIAVPNFDCVHLEKDGVLTAPVFNPYDFVGGILIIKCWQDFIFNGGNIDLTDCGIPVNRKNALRPLTTQETAANGESDFAKLAGQENFITKDRLLLNAGDGAAVIIAKNLICNEDSRIGNPATHGAAFCRGHSTSVGVNPSNITNIGGSTILLAAETIENFNPKLLAKYRSADKPEGRGLARCYIASNTKLRTDEGLYSQDTISDFNRVRELGIENFGNGKFGECTNPAVQLNNYADVVDISQGGYKFRINGNSLTGMALFKEGALAMVLAVQKSDKYTEGAGKFVIGRILKRTGNTFVLDKAAPFDVENYNVQLISIPEFTDLTINTNYNYTPKYDGKKGGVFAVAVAENFNLEGGKINLEGKGGAVAYGRNGLQYIGNASPDRLPIGEGHGSAFILAKNLVINENSRIGALYSGAGEGGRFGGNNASKQNQGGGYAGAPAESTDLNGSGGGFLAGGGTCGLGGSGAAGGTSTRGEFDATKIVGGYGGSNGQGKNAGKAGGHIMIVADTIKNFTQAAISTGGEGAKDAQNGAASYGGGGNAESGGGAGGFAYIYCNSTT